jgi:hypothetical protein
MCGSMKMLVDLCCPTQALTSPWMDVSSARSRADHPVCVIEDNPERAAEARAKVRRVFERMDQLERISARGMRLHMSLQPAPAAQQHAPAKVPLRCVRIRARRPNRRVRPLARRRAGRGARSRDPDLPHPSAPIHADHAAVLGGHVPISTILRSGCGR